MARFRLTGPAQSDLAAILSLSADRWGDEGRHRYALALSAAMRQVATEPEGPLTRNRSELGPGLRSFHTIHSRRAAEPTLARPPHVLYYRVADDHVIEVVRVLHERMDPRRHLDASGD